MMHIIVNADDFGMGDNQTLAILQAYKEGWISTTTAMVNMPWFEKALELAKGTRLYQNIGLHLNLTEGRPLTLDIQKSPLFCDDKGEFNACFHLSVFHRLWLPSFERKAVKNEIAAQIEKFIQSGLPLRHIDSHHHVHTDLAIASIFLPLAKHAGFKTVRLSRNIGSALSLSKSLYKHFINKRFQDYLTRNADFFCTFGDFLCIKEELPKDCTVEIMTHPVFSIGESLCLNGMLTDSFDNKTVHVDFWKSRNRNCDLSDYLGNL